MPRKEAGIDFMGKTKSEKIKIDMDVRLYKKRIADYLFCGQEQIDNMPDFEAMLDEYAKMYIAELAGFKRVSDIKEIEINSKGAV